MSATTERAPHQSRSAPMSPRAENFGSQVAGVAAYLAELPRGDRAVLRRLEKDRESVPPEVFWRIVERYEIPQRAEVEDFWLGVLPLMVKHPHQREARPGRVLARAGISNARVERWLRLDAKGALREAGRLLSKVKDPIDWVSFGFLLRRWDDKSRRDFARDFFLSAARLERADETTTPGDE